MSQMNSKEFVHNTAYSVQLPYIADLPLIQAHLTKEVIYAEAGFKEIKPRLKFEPGRNYGWFHLKL